MGLLDKILGKSQPKETPAQTEQRQQERQRIQQQAIYDQNNEKLNQFQSKISKLDTDIQNIVWLILGADAAGEKAKAARLMAEKNRMEQERSSYNNYINLLGGQKKTIETIQINKQVSDIVKMTNEFFTKEAENQDEHLQNLSEAFLLQNQMQQRQDEINMLFSMNNEQTQEMSYEEQMQQLKQEQNQKIANDFITNPQQFQQTVPQNVQNVNVNPQYQNNQANPRSENSQKQNNIQEQLNSFLN